MALSYVYAAAVCGSHRILYLETRMNLGSEPMSYQYDSLKLLPIKNKVQGYIIFLGNFIYFKVISLKGILGLRKKISPSQKFINQVYTWDSGV